jgi:hypothetical protein
VEYIPGGRQRIPAQTTGPAAAGLEAGRVVLRRRLRYQSGRPVEVVLVALGGRYALDQFLGGRRVARIGVPPDFRAHHGQIRKFEVLPDATVDALGVYLEYARTDSARLLSHYYGVSPHELEFVD